MDATHLTPSAARWIEVLEAATEYLARSLRAGESPLDLSCGGPLARLPTRRRSRPRHQVTGVVRNRWLPTDAEFVPSAFARGEHRPIRDERLKAEDLNVRRYGRPVHEATPLRRPPR